MRPALAAPLLSLGSVVALVAVLPLGACSTKNAAAPADAGPTYPPLDPACDPLVPSHCGFPFPSNFTTVADAKSKTGLRLAFQTAALPTHNSLPTDAAAWADLDGFSADGNLMTDLPGASITGLPTQDTIDASLSAGSPTVIIDAETGERVPHWAELDESVKTGEERIFLLRPVVRLKDSTRYIVAIRHVVDDQGSPLAPSPAFVALRDGGKFGHPSIEARRALYADLFARLGKAGVGKGELQIAWDFTTGSREGHTDWMVHMRDDALKTVGPDGPKYRITETKDDPSPKIKRRIVGKMTVPLYMDKAEPGSHLVFGDDGLPKQNGTAEYEFVVWIPNAATTGTPGPLLQNAHGLLGSKFEGGDGYLADIAESTDMVTFAVDLVGMAHDDVGKVTDALVGDIGGFRDIVGRQHQGILNELLAMRMMKGAFSRDPQVQFAGKSAIDPTQGFYRGDSQGGIFGGTYMALSTDVTRGLLSVPGAPYSLLLNRSADFKPFFFLLGTVYDQSADVQIALGLVQLLWDKTEPAGYMTYITDDTLPGTPKHQILIHPALGDHQVTPLGAERMARAVGARSVAPAVRPIWGVPEAPAPFEGSAIVEFDFGLPEAPKTNTPPTAGEDPHELPRRQAPAIAQANAFFREGVVKQFCKGKCNPGS